MNGNAGLQVAANHWWWLLFLNYIWIEDHEGQKVCTVWGKKVERWNQDELLQWWEEKSKERRLIILMLWLPLELDY